MTWLQLSQSVSYDILPEDRKVLLQNPSVCQLKDQPDVFEFRVRCITLACFYLILRFYSFSRKIPLRYCFRTIHAFQPDTSESVVRYCAKDLIRPFTLRNGVMPLDFIEFEHSILLQSRDLALMLRNSSASASMKRFPLLVEQVRLDSSDEARATLARWPWLLKHYALFPATGVPECISIGISEAADRLGVTLQSLDASHHQILPSAKFQPTIPGSIGGPATIIVLPPFINVVRFDFSYDSPPEQKAAITQLIRSAGPCVNSACFYVIGVFFFIHSVLLSNTVFPHPDAAYLLAGSPLGRSSCSAIPSTEHCFTHCASHLKSIFRSLTLYIRYCMPDTLCRVNCMPDIYHAHISSHLLRMISPFVCFSFDTPAASTFGH